MVTGREQGSGLGLSIAHNIARLPREESIASPALGTPNSSFHYRF